MNVFLDACFLVDLVFLCNSVTFQIIVFQCGERSMFGNTIYCMDLTCSRIFPDLRVTSFRFYINIIDEERKQKNHLRRYDSIQCEIMSTQQIQTKVSQSIHFDDLQTNLPFFWSSPSFPLSIFICKSDPGSASRFFSSFPITVRVLHFCREESFTRS